MAEAILSLHRDRERYTALSQGARKEYQKKFNARAMTAQLEALYEQQVKKGEKK